MRCRSCAQRRRWWGDLVTIRSGVLIEGVAHWEAVVGEGVLRLLCEMRAA